MPGGEPQRFGPYQLISRLGKGGMGETWRAVREGHSGFNKELVIKRILRAHSANERFRANFVNEARLSARLSHGNVAQVFDFGEVDGEYYMAMEYVHGRPLSTLLERAEELGLSVLPLPIATFIVIEMLKGLTHAHGRTDEKGRPLEIVHRDISPDNVMVSFEGEVKLLDFGIARARLEGRQDTQPGVVKGKLMYLSPEQATGKPLDARSDVWATGLVLYRLLSGKLAADHFDAARVLYDLAQGKFTPLTEVAPWVPTTLAEAVAKSLKVNRDERYPSARAFGQELSLYLHRAAPATSEATLMGVMGSLFSRELFDEGREVTILPEVHALLDEARQMVEGAPGKSEPTAPPGEGLGPQVTTGNLAADPAAATNDAVARRRATPEAPVGAPAPNRRAPALFLLACAVLGAAVATGVVWSRRSSGVVIRPAPEPSVPGAVPDPSVVANAQGPDWQRAANERQVQIDGEKATQAAIDARQQEDLGKLDEQLKALSAKEEELRNLKIAAAHSTQGGANKAQKIEALEKQNQDMMKQIEQINAGLASKRAAQGARREKTPEPIEPAKPPRTTAPVGYLTLTTVNPTQAKVFASGRSLGVTPLLKVPFEAGTLRLEVIDAKAKRHSLPVQIEPGKTIEFRDINVEDLRLQRPTDLGADPYGGQTEELRDAPF